MFQTKRKVGRFRRLLLRHYIWGRQSLRQLAVQTGRSHVWVRRHLDAAAAQPRRDAPQPTPLVCDMTFWGRGYGVCVFRSPTLKRNLWWTEARTETPGVYQAGLANLLQEGWQITGAVLDGKRGIASVFRHSGIPVQYCQFHQMKTVTKYLTRRPKTEAARTLRTLACTLPSTDAVQFAKALALWHSGWHAFLDERSPAPWTKRGWQYTHRRIRAAYRSLITNLPCLFTSQQHPSLCLPNTTNCLDGMFSQLKNRLAVHRGLRRHRRYKLIDVILRNSN